MTPSFKGSTCFVVLTLIFIVRNSLGNVGNLSSAKGNATPDDDAGGPNQTETSTLNTVPLAQSSSQSFQSNETPTEQFRANSSDHRLQSEFSKVNIVHEPDEDRNTHHGSNQIAEQAPPNKPDIPAPSGPNIIDDSEDWEMYDGKSFHPIYAPVSVEETFETIAHNVDNQEDDKLLYDLEEEVEEVVSNDVATNFSKEKLQDVSLIDTADDPTDQASTAVPVTQMNDHHDMLQSDQIESLPEISSPVLPPNTASPDIQTNYLDVGSPSQDNVSSANQSTSVISEFERPEVNIPSANRSTSVISEFERPEVDIPSANRSTSVISEFERPEVDIPSANRSTSVISEFERPEVNIAKDTTNAYHDSQEPSEQVTSTSPDSNTFKNVLDSQTSYPDVGSSLPSDSSLAGQGMTAHPKQSDLDDASPEVIDPKPVKDDIEFGVENSEAEDPFVGVDGFLLEISVTAVLGVFVSAFVHWFVKAPEARHISTTESSNPKSESRKPSKMLQLRKLEQQNTELEMDLKSVRELVPLNNELETLRQKDLDREIRKKKNDHSTLETFKSLQEVNVSLKKKVNLSRYVYLQLLVNSIDIDDLLDVIDNVVSDKAVEDREEHIIKMQAEFDLNKDQVQIFEKTTSLFLENIDQLNRKLVDEKRRKMKIDSEKRRLISQKVDLFDGDSP